MTGAFSDPSDVRGLQQQVRLAEERVAAVEGAPANDQERIDALIELAVAQENLWNRLREQRDADDYEAVVVESDLGTTRFKLGDLPKALQLREDVVDRLQSTRGPDDRATLVAEYLLAEAVKATGDYQRAERIETDVLVTRVRVDPSGPDTDRARCFLADTRRTLGKMRSAAQLYARAVEGFEKSLGAGDGETIDSRGNLAVCLLAMGKYYEARTLVTQAQQMASRTLTPDADARMRIDKLSALLATIDQQIESRNPVRRRLARAQLWWRDRTGTRYT